MNKWDYRFLKIAKEVGTWSKDPSTQVGAIAVNDKRIIATGYNGFPKGIKDTDELLSDRQAKLKLMVHAEMNMIYNATQHGVSLEGSTVYIHGLPACEDCFKGLIQIGVARVVMPDIEVHGKKWKAGCEFGKAQMKYVGMAVDEYNMFHDWQWNTDGTDKDTISEPYTAEEHYGLKHPISDKNHGDEIELDENGY